MSAKRQGGYLMADTALRIKTRGPPHGPCTGFSRRERCMGVHEGVREDTPAQPGTPLYINDLFPLRRRIMGKGAAAMAER